MAENDDNAFSKPRTRAIADNQSSEVKQTHPLVYEKPSWGAVASYGYTIEVLKGGSSIDLIHGAKKDFITIGRLPLCDIQMEHQSISRYHAILQFNADGDAFLYDLNSAHGTKLNKKLVPPQTYQRLQPGDQLRFGDSTRIYIYDTEKPIEEPEEEEVEPDQLIKASSSTKTNENEEDHGATWGFAEDAQQEDDEDGQVRNRSLKRGGDATLLSLEAEQDAAANAKRRREDLEIMFGDDSDEDLYDKTNSAKKKKEKKEKAGTYDEFVQNCEEIEKKIAELQQKIAQKEEEESANKAKKDDAKDNEEEDLDAYMKTLDKMPDNKVSLFALRKELKTLQKDHERLVKLIKLTKPSDISFRS